MRAAAAAARSAGITRSAALAAYYSAERLTAYEFFNEALSGTDAETLQEFLDQTLRGKRPRRKKRTTGKYLAAGLATGAALTAQQLRKRALLRRLRRAQSVCLTADGRRQTAVKSRPSSTSAVSGLPSAVIGGSNRRGIR